MKIVEKKKHILTHHDTKNIHLLYYTHYIKLQHLIHLN